MSFQKACYAALDAMDDDSLQQYMANRYGAGAKAYQADGNVDGEEEPPAEAGSYDQSPGAATGISAEGEKTIKEQGAEEPMSSSYAKGSKQQSEKYQLDSLRADVAKLKAERESERQLRIDAERRGRLEFLRNQGFSFDVDKAMGMLRYERCDDKHFEEQLGFMAEHIARAPIGHSLPNVPGAEKYERHAPGFREASAEKYSKEDQENAMKAVRTRMKTAGERYPDTTGWLDEELENARRSRMNGSAA